MNWIWNVHCSLLNRLDVKEVFGCLIASAHFTEVTFATLFVTFRSHLPDQSAGASRARTGLYSSLSLSLARNEKRKKVKKVRKEWKQWGWRKEARNVNKRVCKAISINVAGDNWKLSIIYQLNKMVISVKTLTGQREQTLKNWKTTSNAQ